MHDATPDPLAEQVAATAKAAEVASAALSRLVLAAAGEDDVRRAYRDVAAADAARTVALAELGRPSGAGARIRMARVQRGPPRLKARTLCSAGLCRP